MTRALMIQGTGSDVGKSLLVAGLARAFTRRGLRVRPFKPQNMSNNAAVTADGGEIGRAQALQARAARVAPSVHMNPVLLKPQSEVGAQVVVQGRMIGTARARDYQAWKPRLMESVLDSFERLRADSDLVLVEGAGSPAEVNLRRGDIANMGFARRADVPVILIGDIDRGGVIAAVVGTRAVIDPADTAMIAGFIINKFRGDPALFEDGYRQIEALSGWRGYGVLPWLPETARLPSEDAVVLEKGRVRNSDRLLIACPILPRISNFDDLDPLKLEPGVELLMVPPGQPIPADAAMIVLPGSKATIADLAALRAEGWDIDLRAHHRRGGAILGLCGGYQMLGRTIADPDGLEGPPSSVEGLGLLDIDTRLTPVKTLRPVGGMALGAHFSGYEMHMGESSGPGMARPFARFDDGQADGAIDPTGQVMGSYVHGLLAMGGMRAALLARIGIAGNGADHGASVDAALDAIAAQMEAHLDIDAMVALATAKKEKSA